MTLARSVILRKTCKAHRRAGNILLRRCQEVVQMIEGPLLAAALGEVLHGRRIGEALVRGDRAIDDTIEVRADFVRPPLVAVMTSLTLLEDSFAGLGVCLRQAAARSERLQPVRPRRRQRRVPLRQRSRNLPSPAASEWKIPSDAMETDIRTKTVPSNAPTAVFTYEFICNAPLAAGRQKTGPS